VRRAGLAALAVVVALAGAVGLIAFFQSRDEGSLDHEQTNAPGVVAAELDSDELAAGNVVLTYRESGQRAALKALAEDVAGPTDPALAEAGQSVIVHARPSGGGGVIAEAYKRRLEVASADDPQLRPFIEYWLGRGRAG
jgi:hypothetical protein